MVEPCCRYHSRNNVGAQHLDTEGGGAQSRKCPHHTCSLVCFTTANVLVIPLELAMPYTAVFVSSSKSKRRLYGQVRVTQTYC